MVLRHLVLFFAALHAIAAAEPAPLAGPLVASRPAPLLPAVEDARANLQRWCERLGPAKVSLVRKTPVKDYAVARVVWLETGLKHPLVRLEQCWVRSDAADGAGTKLLNEQAMVGSHLLAGLRPEAVRDEVVAALRVAGFEATPVPLADRLLRVAVPRPTEAGSYEAVLKALPGVSPGIAFAEPDALIFADSIPSDPLCAEQWNLFSKGDEADAAIRADAGWAIRSDAAEIVVAIVDTGLRTTHEDLAPNLWRNSAEIPANGLDDDKNGIVDDVHGFDAAGVSGDVSDENGHGTQVAGVVGARGDNALGVAGVAWKVRLMACKFMDGQGAGTVSDAVSAIHYARLQGARLINASWGLDFRSLALEDALKQTGEKGVALIASAGNRRADIDAVPRYPAAFDLPHVVAVAATGRQRTLNPVSNYGRNRVHLAAPGEDILAPGHRSDHDYGLAGGTSLAAPQVTGALALLLALHPAEDGGKLIRRLLAGVRPAPALEGLVRTGGILDLPTLLAAGASLPGGAPGKSARFTPPANDLRAAATELSGNGFLVFGHNRGAGAEAGEPRRGRADARRSVWWSWKAPRSARQGFATPGCAFDTVLAVYRADADGKLIEVAINDDLDERTVTSRVVFDAREGVRYLIAVDSRDGMEGDIRLAGYGPDDIVLLEEPRAQSVRLGGSVTLQAPFLALNSPTIRWFKDGKPVEGNANGDLVLSRVGPGELGGYHAVLSRSPKIVTTRVAPITEFASPPALEIPPEGFSAVTGSSAILRIGATGKAPFSYEWFKEGDPRPVATSKDLFFGELTEADAGRYHVVVTNSLGWARSTPIPFQVVASPFPAWSWATASGQGWPIRDLRYFGDTYHALASSSRWTKIMRSKNGVDWSEQPLPPMFQGLQIAHGKGLTLVAGSSEYLSAATSGIYRSADGGATWSFHELPFPEAITSLHFGNDCFVARTFDGLLRRSTDGIAWVQPSVPPEIGVGRLAFQGAWFFAWSIELGKKSAQLFRSADGQTWNSYPADSRIEALVFREGLYHLWTDDSRLQSADGLTWTKSGENKQPRFEAAMIHDGHRFISADSNQITTSEDGKSWSGRAIPGAGTVYPDVTALLHADGRTLLGYSSGAISAFDDITRADFRKGTDWGWVSPQLTSSLAFYEGEFILSGGTNADRVALSADGANWKTIAIPNQPDLDRSKIWKAGDRYWAGSQNHRAASIWGGDLPNTLKVLTVPVSGGLQDIVRFQGRYLAVIGNNLCSSKDGAGWSVVECAKPRPPEAGDKADAPKFYPLPANLRLRQFGKRCFLFGHHVLASSEDGVSWRHANPPKDKYREMALFTDVVEYKGRYYAALDRREIWESDDGVNWSGRPLPFDPARMERLHVHRGALVCFPQSDNNGEQLRFTTDLQTWHRADTRAAARRFAAGNGVLVGMGSVDQRGQTFHIVYNGTPSPPPPVCRFLTPRPDSHATRNGVVEIAVDASGDAASFAGVDLYVDGKLVASSPRPGVLVHAFVPAEERSYSFRARARNAEGASVSDFLVLTAKSSSPAPLPGSSHFTLKSLGVAGGAYYSANGDSLLRSVDGLKWDTVSVTGATDTPKGLGASAAPPLVLELERRVLISKDGMEWARLVPDQHKDFGPLQLRSGVYFRSYATSSAGLGGVAVSVGGDEWTVTPPAKHTCFSAALMTDGPRFVGWSESGVSRSDDGLRWKLVPGLPAPRVGVEFRGRFILLGRDNHVRGSADGIDWTDTDLGFAATRLIVAGDLVFALDDAFAWKASADGVEWKALEGPPSGDGKATPRVAARHLVHGHGRYLAVGHDASVSLDGFTWTAAGRPWKMTPVSVVHGPAGFLATDPGWLSTDGVNWTPAYLPDDYWRWQDFAEVGNTWLALREVDARFRPLQISTDRGRTWRAAPVPYAYPVSGKALRANGSAFVLLDSKGLLRRSTDGETWHEVPVKIDGTAVKVIKFYAEGDLWHALAGDAWVYRSADGGATWARHPVDPDGSSRVEDLLFSGESYLALVKPGASYNLAAFRSADGATWALATLPEYFNNNDRYAAGHGRFVITTSDLVRVSKDGASWSKGKNSPGSAHGLVKTTTGFLLPVSELGGFRFYFSKDAESWTAGPPVPIGRIVELGGDICVFGHEALTPLYRADLVVTSVVLERPGVYGEGGAPAVDVTVVNGGETILPDLDFALHASLDGVHENADDTPLGLFPVRASDLPPPGETRVLRFSPPLPALEPGLFRIGVRANASGRVGEFNQANNWRYSASASLDYQSRPAVGSAAPAKKTAAKSEKAKASER